jgi:Putative transposase
LESYFDGAQSLTLDTHEFIRRFLLHVIPKSFVRVRHFGFWQTDPKAF